MTEPIDPYLLVAAIAGAFGVRGEVKLKSFTEDPKACLTYGPLTDSAGRVILTPKSSRLVKNALAVTCKEVTTREQAEAMKSVKLYVRRSSLPAADEDEFYYSDLIGLHVQSLDGEAMGKIKSVQNFGSGDLLEILPEGEKSYFLPFTKAAVPRVALAQGFAVIDPPDVIEGEPRDAAAPKKPQQ